jgi:peroxiredoxin family protein
MRRDGVSALHVRRVSETQPQAQVLQGMIESLKKAEKETQHFGISVLACVMLHTICQLAKDDLLVGIPLGSG